ncbi:MAG: hypothetical protein JSW07_10090 [bacterium]|nr:MAG: hypothetical protein JSW07_10090 [bacterium]
MAITKEAILSIWNFVRQLFIDYRNHWSLDNINTRKQAADRIRSRIPKLGWLIRVLNNDNRFVSTDILLTEWQNQ